MTNKKQQAFEKWYEANKDPYINLDKFDMQKVWDHQQAKIDVLVEEFGKILTMLNRDFDTHEILASKLEIDSSSWTEAVRRFEALKQVE